MARQIRWRGALSPDTAGDGRAAERTTWRPGSPVVPPQSILETVRLLQVGAVLSLLEVPRAFFTRGALHTAFAAEARSQGARVNASDLDSIVALSLTISIAWAVVSAVAWFSLAQAASRGSWWARWLGCALYAIALVVFFGGLLPTAGLFARTLALSLLLIGAWTLVRWWHRDSSAWIRYSNRPVD
ncbi:hypothetical protein [Pedococcus sp. 2YAF34]|uniref:hypothetical protein n=1 Tax=Pedococcus sp. 2YAF34 TaxID=3233032 RepID=UPI003F9AD921